jgi:hypothetical protein
MGHIRLGRLPKRRNWRQVVDLIDTAPFDTAAVAGATARAARQHFEELSGDPGIGYNYWLLTQITWSARAEDFVERLKQVGIDVEKDSSVFSFIAQLADHARSRTAAETKASVFAEMATLSLQQALTQTIVDRARTLFGSTTTDIQAACRYYSTTKRFGVLSRRFFAAFLARALKFLVNKELSNHVGPGHTVENVDEAKEFNDALTEYTWQSARIVEDFASGWYSLHNGQAKGQIPEHEARGFVAVAIRKLQMELAGEGGSR